jgi:hypothetical protein
VLIYQSPTCVYEAAQAIQEGRLPDNGLWDTQEKGMEAKKTGI